MYRLLCTFLLVCLGLSLIGHTAAAMPHTALIEAAGLSVVEPTAATPLFTLNDHQGKPFKIQDQRGKVVLMNFWATWCPPCIHEMPTMDQLYRSAKDRPFNLLAVNMQETQEDVSAFLKKRDFQFAVLLDVEGAVVGSYQVRGLPSTFLIDCSGNLIGSVTGVLKWTDPPMYALLDALYQDPACHMLPTPSDPTTSNKSS